MGLAVSQSVSMLPIGWLYPITGQANTQVAMLATGCRVAMPNMRLAARGQ